MIQEIREVLKDERAALLRERQERRQAEKAALASEKKSKKRSGTPSTRVLCVQCGRQTRPAQWDRSLRRCEECELTFRVTTRVPDEEVRTGNQRRNASNVKNAGLGKHGGSCTLSCSVSLQMLEFR